ncbi:hypothetical protein ADT28_05420 [Xylella fastidiosa]|nr:hypothetical protein OY18_04250 [Xylella fastidiosa]OCA57883.1 hypothetical protein AA93_06940 [Xylella fastidiosa subsp. pauca 11399]KXB13489.1 hypothetical protein ADT29_07935 [Xylella fastidiosa]KXB21341.1 hypothetical protein ADT28_05420 [Xylella fastidiosa]NRP55963.1 hypothetical protein [Xylella fastidiosa]
MIDKSVLAKAHYKANEAARVIEQAPLFCWNGIKDAKGEELQPVFYTEAPLIVNSEKGIFIHAISEAGFSRLVLDCFKVLETCYVMKGYSRTHLILVHPFHSLYPQIKIAAARAALEAAKKEACAAYDAAKDEEARDAAFAAARAALATYEAAEAAVSDGVAA